MQPTLSLLLLSLARMPDEFENWFQTVPADFVDWRPKLWDGIPGEKFSALEQACHLRDIEIDGYHIRIRRVLEEDRPRLVSIDSYDLAKERNYSADKLQNALLDFRKARKATTDMLGRIKESEMNRPAFFEDYGEITLKGLIHLLCSHDQQHLACMHWLLGRIESDRTIN